MFKGFFYLFGILLIASVAAFIYYRKKQKSDEVEDAKVIPLNSILPNSSTATK